MHPDPIDYDQIERRVTLRFQRRYRFFIHTAVFVIGIPLLAQFNSAELFLIWVSLWLFHLIWMHYQHNLELAIDDEIEFERDRMLKRKRDAAGPDEVYFVEVDDWVDDDNQRDYS